MALVRISDVKPLNAFQVEITLTTGEIVQRDLRPLLKGPVFDSIRTDWSGVPPTDSASCAA